MSFQDCIMPEEPQPFMFGCVKLFHDGIGSLRLSQPSTEREFMWEVRKWKCSRDNESVLQNNDAVLCSCQVAFHPSSWKILRCLSLKWIDGSSLAVTKGKSSFYDAAVHVLRRYIASSFCGLRLLSACLVHWVRCFWQCCEQKVQTDRQKVFQIPHTKSMENQKWWSGIKWISLINLHIKS